MEIPFWGIHRENGVSSNITAVSIMGVLESKYNVILTENHSSTNNLGDRLIFTWNGNEVKEAGSYGPGYSGRLADDMIEIISNRLYYIPIFPVRKDCFEFDFYQNMLSEIRDRKNRKRLIMIDTDNGRSISFQDILHTSELVIVNLSQDLIRTEIFMEEYSSIMDKAVFIVGQYRRCKVNKVKKLLISYGVALDRIAIIPYNDEFDAAMVEGRSVEFINRNYKCRKGTQNYYFISELKKATKMILKHVDNVMNQKPYRCLD